MTKADLPERLKEEAEFFSPSIPTRPIRQALSEVDCRHLDRVSPLLTEAASLIQRLEGERDELRMAITGGEDAPGHNASLAHDTILRVLADNYASLNRNAELAWDGETATSWKSKARTAEQALSASQKEVLGLRKALADISIRAITGQLFETLEYKDREFKKIEDLSSSALQTGGKEHG